MCVWWTSVRPFYVESCWVFSHSPKTWGSKLSQALRVNGVCPGYISCHRPMCDRPQQTPMRALRCKVGEIMDDGYWTLPFPVHSLLVIKSWIFQINHFLLGHYDFKWHNQCPVYRAWAACLREAFLCPSLQVEWIRKFNHCCVCRACKQEQIKII